MTWTTAEAGVAILVASSALLRPVFDGLFHRVLSLSSVKTPGPSNVSDPYMGSQSRMNAKQRREFVNVGHVSSHCIWPITIFINITSHVDQIADCRCYCSLKRALNSRQGALALRSRRARDAVKALLMR